MLAVSRNKLLAIVVALAILSGAIFWQTTMLQQTVKVNVVVAQIEPSVTQIQLPVGFKKGFFRESMGANVELQRRVYSSGTEIATAFRNDEIQIAYMGSVPAVLSYAQKPNLKIIGGTNIGGTLLVAREGINSLQDLKGKTIAVPGRANFQDVILRSHILAAEGLLVSTKAEPGKVAIVIARPPEMLQKLREGSVDAIIVWEPWASRVLLDTTVKTKVLVDWREIWKNGQYPSSVLVAHRDFLAQQRGLVKKFLQAHVEATMFALNDYKEAQRLLFEDIRDLKGAELPLEVIQRAARSTLPTYDPNIAAVVEFISLARKAYPDIIASEPKAEDLVDLSVLNEVLKEKGLPNDPLAGVRLNMRTISYFVAGEALESRSPKPYQGLSNWR